SAPQLLGWVAHTPFAFLTMAACMLLILHWPPTSFDAFQAPHGRSGSSGLVAPNASYPSYLGYLGELSDEDPVCSPENAASACLLDGKAALAQSSIQFEENDVTDPGYS